MVRRYESFSGNTISEPSTSSRLRNASGEAVKYADVSFPRLPRYARHGQA